MLLLEEREDVLGAIGGPKCQRLLIVLVEIHARFTVSRVARDDASVVGRCSSAIFPSEAVAFC
jgi:hypothetical protein